MSRSISSNLLMIMIKQGKEDLFAKYIKLYVVLAGRGQYLDELLFLMTILPLVEYPVDDKARMENQDGQLEMI